MGPLHSQTFYNQNGDKGNLSVCSTLKLSRTCQKGAKNLSSTEKNPIGQNRRDSLWPKWIIPEKRQIALWMSDSGTKVCPKAYNMPLILKIAEWLRRMQIFRKCSTSVLTAIFFSKTANSALICTFSAQNSHLDRSQSQFQE